MRKLFLLFALTAWMNIQAQTVNKVVGGDISLVPSYEAAGDVWLDADDKPINTSYSDGMITFLHEVAGWNAVRIRLLVEPDNDGYLATCQDLDYVKKLGKRVKDAGMSFLLDIFFSDTWADVQTQWIPQSWNMNRNTSTDTMAEKVKNYTTEVINALNAYGAPPDYVQLGNEVSYGMLWDSKTGASKNNAFYTSSTFENYSPQIRRFAQLLKAGAEGVRQSDCPEAKILLHCERTASTDQTLNFYEWVEGYAGFTDYDIIGLSYYPQWHGTLDNFANTLHDLENGFPDKEIQIVETGYYNTGDVNPTYNTSDTWPYSPAGQAAFLKDLIEVMKQHENVTGLYYWQPEECGNGAGEDGKNRVMDSWDKRGFWEITWKTSQHALLSREALMTLKSFISEDVIEDTDMTDRFSNMNFEECKYNDEGGYVSTCPGWDFNYDSSWSSGPWPVVVNEWHSSLCDGYALQGWNAGGHALGEGYVLRQSADNMPAGIYTVSAVVHTDYDGVCIYANDDMTKIKTTSEWGTAYEVKVNTVLSEPGSISLGLKFLEVPSTEKDINLYADNFKCTYKEIPDGIINVNDNLKTPSDNSWYDLGGRHVNGEPVTPGIYICNGKKWVVR